MGEDPVESLRIDRLLENPKVATESPDAQIVTVTEEKKRVQKRIEGFEWRESTVWRTLTAKFGSKLTHEELVSIAELVAMRAHLRLDRDARRRKVVILKWFEENWHFVQPLLPMIVLGS